MTALQIGAIISLLVAFNVPSATVLKVQGILNNKIVVVATTTPQNATPLPTPVPVVQTQPEVLTSTTTPATEPAPLVIATPQVASVTDYKLSLDSNSSSWGGAIGDFDVQYDLGTWQPLFFSVEYGDLWKSATGVEITSGNSICGVSGQASTAVCTGSGQMGKGTTHFSVKLMNKPAPGDYTVTISTLRINGYDGKSAYITKGFPVTFTFVSQ